MLDAAKIESGKVEWAETRIDLKEVISDTLAAMGQVFSDKRIRVESRLPDGVPAVRADLDRMIQVMLNLLSNAAKFCDPAEGRIEVTLTGRDRMVRVDVRDNGRGVEPEPQEAVFSKFHQAEDGSAGEPRGTGLGLHISGRMWVESRRGGGACFSFTLPTGAPA